jgi:cholest-4-en-3-one 26-monooxygenase
MPTPNLPPGFDFLDPDRNVKQLPVDELAELRKVAPIWWCEQAIGKGGFNDGGYWVVTKHKDVKRSPGATTSTCPHRIRRCRSSPMT